MSQIIHGSLRAIRIRLRQSRSEKSSNEGSRERRAADERECL
jgi:hypothetical protein